jgi:DNA polymerase III delta prime subunit
MDNKQKAMTRLSMIAATCGVSLDSIFRYSSKNSKSEKRSEEVQKEKMLNAEIKRTRKAMIKAGHSKEEIVIAIRKLSGES